MSVSIILPAIARNTVFRSRPLPVVEDVAVLGNVKPFLLTGFVTVPAL